MSIHNILPKQLYARSLVLVSSPLLALVGCEIVGLVLGRFLPGIITNLLLLMPQYVFPFSHYHYVTHEPYTTVHTFGGSHAVLYSVLQWSVVVSLIAWVVRKRSASHIIVFALGTIILVTIATHAAISEWGYTFELEGP